MACLCAPTSHEGSFRCRLHRGLNLIPNPAPNHPIKGLNYCPNSINALPNQICCNPLFTVRDSSASASASASAVPQPGFDDHVRFSHTPQVASDHLNSMRTRSSSTSTSSTCPSASYTSSSTSPWSSSSYRSLSSLPSSFYTSSSSSSSRASASSSSPSPSSPSCYTRPPPGKRTSSSSSPPSKSPYRVSSTSSWCGANGTTPNASHAAALAIMKQHSHNKHGTRTHNRNILSPTSASKIGPSRLSRMAVACSDELPLLKDEQCISNLPRHGSAADTFSGSYAETREFASFKAEPSTSMKTRTAVNKFKQSESSCRVVGSKGGSLIMPTVY